MSNTFFWETPYGTYDLLPNEAYIKRTIETKISKLFVQWGYEEVFTPTIEYLDNLISDSTKETEKSLFKLLSYDNNIMALRHEMTTPLARVVSSKLKNVTLPMKLSYINNVFRLEQTQRGRQCEFHQAGVEIMGSSQATADAEVVALAIECIRCLNIDNFQISLGQVDFLNGFLEQLDFDIYTKKQIKHAIQNRNLVLLSNIVNNLSVDADSKKKLSQLPLLNGDETILEQARLLSTHEKSVEALDNLRDIYNSLKIYGLSKYVTFDLNIIRDFDYYTGMVFEGYSYDLGYPLCGGGRYDNLLDKFGVKMPATGFAIGIERLILVLKRQHKDVVNSNKLIKDMYIGYDKNSIEKAIIRAKELRQFNRNVNLSLTPQTISEVEDFVVNQGYKEYEYFSV